MAALIHILGSPIDHHNHTVLAFLQEYHATYLKDDPDFEIFMAVNECNDASLHSLTQRYPDLNIQCFIGKNALAQALLEHTQQVPTAEYFLHGQFNPKIWFNILLNKMDGKRFKWHVWGADLYEEERTLKYKIFYILRRLAQSKIGMIYATKGDIRVLKSKLSSPNTQKLYFPTKMNMALTPSTLEKQQKLSNLLERTPEKEMTLLLGNSGDKTNNHCLGLTQIANTFGQGVKIVIPMGYPSNNEMYIQKVRQHALSLFPPEQVNILTTNLPFEQYLAMLNSCHLAYFLFERQQGVGTISLCIQLGIPFVLHPRNAFIDDLKEEQIPYFLLKDPVTKEHLVNAQTALNALKIENIGFFAPNYMPSWHEVLSGQAEDIRDLS